MKWWLWKRRLRRSTRRQREAMWFGRHDGCPICERGGL